MRNNMLVLSLCFIVFSMTLLVTSIFTSPWFIVSRNVTTFYYGMSIYCINGTFSCQSIESNNIDLKMDTHLIVLKILVTFCLVMHTVWLFQIYLVRKGNIKSIVISQNITGILLPAIEITIITLFLKNVLFCEDFSISWSFYIFCRVCYICVMIFLTHAIKRFIAYENSHCTENEVFHSGFLQ